MCVQEKKTTLIKETIRSEFNLDRPWYIASTKKIGDIINSFGSESEASLAC